MCEGPGATTSDDVVAEEAWDSGPHGEDVCYLGFVATDRDWSTPPQITFAGGWPRRRAAGVHARARLVAVGPSGTICSGCAWCLGRIAALNPEVIERRPLLDAMASRARVRACERRSLKARHPIPRVDAVGRLRTGRSRAVRGHLHRSVRQRVAFAYAITEAPRCRRVRQRANRRWVRRARIWVRSDRRGRGIARRARASAEAYELASCSARLAASSPTSTRQPPSRHVLEAQASS